MHRTIEKLHTNDLRARAAPQMSDELEIRRKKNKAISILRRFEEQDEQNQVKINSKLERSKLLIL